MTIHLSILIFWPLVFGVLGAFVPRRAAPVFAFVGAIVPLAYAVLMVLDFEAGARGLQYLTDDEWIPDLGIHYRLGVDGLNLWLVALTALLGDGPLTAFEVARATYGEAFTDATASSCASST